MRGKMKKLLFCLGMLISLSAFSEDKVVRCEISSSGQQYLGNCKFSPQKGGTFTLSSTISGKALGKTDINSVTVFISAKDVAQVSGEMGGSISRWGQAKRSTKDKACWIGDDFQVCAR
jgi:hypothetical protein